MNIVVVVVEVFQISKYKLNDLGDIRLPIGSLSRRCIISAPDLNCI